MATSELVLMTMVARRYYVGQQTKVEIAEALGVSRFRVARLLEQALASGVVRIEVGMPGDRELGLSVELRETYDLLHCVVVDDPEDKQLRHAVGQAVSRLLSEILRPHDVLGLSSTRVLMGLRDDVKHFPPCPVVQTTGAISRPDASDVMEAVRRFTRAGGGPAYVFYAP